MGTSVGENDGLSMVGALVGASVGTMFVGLLVGPFVGLAEGTDVSITGAIEVGATVVVPFSVGAVVGAKVELLSSSLPAGAVPLLLDDGETAVGADVVLIDCAFSIHTFGAAYAHLTHTSTITYILYVRIL